MSGVGRGSGSPFSRRACPPRPRSASGPAKQVTAIKRLALACVLTLGATTTPTTASDLTAELQQLDALVAKSTAVSADYRQEKFTPLLKRPLVSTGHVAARGDESLWTTAAPRRSVMHVTPTEIRIHYPEQAVVEVYPVQGQLGAMAASPLPRLATLRQFFTFARLPSTDDGVLSLQLTPSTDELKQHVREVRVTLDRSTGAIRRAETIDADGDRTVLTFTAVDLHATVTDADLKLTTPAGTRETHPLAGLAPADAPKR